jgi:hypothetical protein
MLSRLPCDHYVIMRNPQTHNTHTQKLHNLIPLFQVNMGALNELSTNKDITQIIEVRVCVCVCVKMCVFLLACV